MNNIEIKLHKVYELIENSPIITINSTQDKRVGSLNTLFPNFTILIYNKDGKSLRIGQESEIYYYSPNIMRKYYEKPDTTSQVITTASDRHFRLFYTGNLDKINKDSYFHITG